MVVSLFELRSTINFFNDDTERSAWNHARFEGSELSGALEYFIRIEDKNGAKKTISRASEDPDLIRAILLDENNEVFLSTRYEYVNKAFREIATAEEIQIINSARETFQISQKITEDRKTIKSAFPLFLGAKEDELRVTIAGILYLEHDLKQQKLRGKQIAFDNFYKFSAIFGIVCFLLWVFFERSLMGKIQKLVEGSQRLAEGDYHTQVNLKGNDELSYLGKSFDSMAQMIRKNNLELEQREEQIRLLLDSTGESIYGIDTEGRCTFANEALLRTLGFKSIKELKGKKIHSLIRHSDRHGNPYKEEKCPILKALDEDRGVSLKEEFIWKADGTSFPVDLWSHPIRHKGDTLGAVVTFVDITERKREEMLREHLTQAEKLSAIGTFVSGVAHELNNPLTAVLGYSNELLKEKGIPEEPRKFIEIIATQTSRATDIVKSLLEFSRKETKGKVITDINKVLETSLNFQEYRFKKDNITINKEYATELPPVKVDVNQFQQVFINIILNAHHAMLRGERQGELTVKTAFENEKVKISFENNGPRIPQAALPKIFDPFYTTKGVGDGTGLGLYISFGIVTEHGGSIQAMNLPKEGVCFEINLSPTKEKKEELKPTQKQVQIPAGTRILLIEEEEDIRNWLASSLIKQGIFTMAVGSIEEAEKLLMESDFGVVISSAIMFKRLETGLEDWLLQNKPEVLSKLIIASSDIDGELKNFCDKNDCSFIAKPYSLEDILNEVSAIVNAREKGKEL